MNFKNYCLLAPVVLSVASVASAQSFTGTVGIQEDTSQTGSYTASSLMLDVSNFTDPGSASGTFLSTVPGGTIVTAYSSNISGLFWYPKTFPFLIFCRLVRRVTLAARELLQTIASILIYKPWQNHLVEILRGPERLSTLKVNTPILRPNSFFPFPHPAITHSLCRQSPSQRRSASSLPDSVCCHSFAARVEEFTAGLLAKEAADRPTRVLLNHPNHDRLFTLGYLFHFRHQFVVTSLLKAPL